MSSAWGPGLYACELARDLKGIIAGVVKLPHDADELVGLMTDLYKTEATKENHNDHVTFWLALADRLHGHGITHQDTFDRAIAMIDDGADLHLPRYNSKQNPGDAKARQKMFDALRTKLSSPAPQKPRKVMKAPQPLLMNAGDIIVYPVIVKHGSVYASNEKPSQTTPDTLWGAMMILDSGRLCDYLAWYHPVVITTPLKCRTLPTVDAALDLQGWKTGDGYTGTCSKAQFADMALETIGRVELNPSKCRPYLPKPKDVAYLTIQKIRIGANGAMDISNQMGPSEKHIQSLKGLLA